MYIDFVTQIACKSALTVLLIVRRVFASQRVPVCLPATLVDSSSFCFATCVCLPATLVDSSSCVDPSSMWKFVALVASEERKSIPGGTKIDPLELQNRAKIDLGAPRSAQERPRAPQKRPKSDQRAPQERPRAPQERPRAPQEHPRACQERPRSPRKCPRVPHERPRSPRGHKNNQKHVKT